jgi:FAD/FMN-containing dehydrogenase
MWPEFVDAAIAATASQRRWPSAFAGRRVVLLEVEGDALERLTGLLEHALGQLYDHGLLVDVLVAQSHKDAADLWSIRESIGEIQSVIRPYAGFDLGIPVKEHDGFKARACAALAAAGLPAKALFFGHAGDGNLHALIGPCASPDERQRVEDTLHRLLPRYRSTVTAEHGVGRKRKHVLNLSRTEAEIAAMKTLKRALDPNGILNPGRIFDL